MNFAIQEIKEQPDNDKILSAVLADKVREARKLKNPSADELLNSIPKYKVVCK